MNDSNDNKSNNNHPENVKEDGEKNMTNINANNAVQEPIRLYNQEVLNRFHEELLKLINRNNIMFGTKETATQENKVSDCYCTPNGIFVVKLTKTNCGLDYLQGLQSQSQLITDNKRIKDFLTTNDIKYNDETTIGDLVSQVKEKCNKSPTKLKHIKRMSKSKEHELADQYLVSNLLKIDDNKLLSTFKNEEKNIIKLNASKLHNKTLRQQNIPFYERFFDKINRLWFRWRFRRGCKVNYNKLCGRDWDTGKLTR